MYLQYPNMEEVFLRFPHIGEQVFEELGDQNLIQCLSVSRNWRNLLEDCKFLWIRMILGISNHGAAGDHESSTSVCNHQGVMSYGDSPKQWSVCRVKYYKSKRILKKSNSQYVKKMQIAALETLTNGRSCLWVIHKHLDSIGDVIYIAIKSGQIEIFKEVYKMCDLYLNLADHKNLLNYAADQGNLLRSIDNKPIRS